MRITDAVLARADVVLFFGRKGECNEPSLLFVMRYTPPTYSESAPSGAVELSLRSPRKAFIYGLSGDFLCPFDPTLTQNTDKFEEKNSGLKRIFVGK